MNIVKVFNDGKTRVVIEDHGYGVEIYQSDKKRWKKTRWISVESMHELQKLPADPNDANLFEWNKETIRKWILDAIVNSYNQEYLIKLASDLEPHLDRIEAGITKDCWDESVNISTVNPEVKFLINSVKGKFISISKFVDSNKENVVICSELARWYSE